MTTLLSLPAITNAISQTATPWFQIKEPQLRNLLAQANFTFGTGTGTFDAYLQTSLDGGATATDIAHYQFVGASARKLSNHTATTANTGVITGTDGGLTANTIQDSVLGDRFRVKYSSLGTYGGGTTFALDVSSASRLVAGVQ